LQRELGAQESHIGRSRHASSCGPGTWSRKKVPRRVWSQDIVGTWPLSHPRKPKHETAREPFYLYKVTLSDNIPTGHWVHQRASESSLRIRVTPWLLTAPQGLKPGLSEVPVMSDVITNKRWLYPTLARGREAGPNTVDCVQG
jgi:hypothetical protein